MHFISSSPASAQNTITTIKICHVTCSEREFSGADAGVTLTERRAEQQMKRRRVFIAVSAVRLPRRKAETLQPGEAAAAAAAAGSEPTATSEDPCLESKRSRDALGLIGEQ